MQRGVEFGQGVDSDPVEMGPVELGEHGALEPFDDGVVVGAASRDAMVYQAELGEPAGERPPGELWPIVCEHALELGADGAQRGPDLGEEPGSDGGALVADDEPRDRPAGGDVDGGELVDRTDAFELAYVEGVQTDQLTWAGGGQTEPVGPILGGVGQQPRFRGGDRSKGRNALPPRAQPMMPQHLLHPRGAAMHATGGKVVEQLPGRVGRATASARIVNTSWAGIALGWAGRRRCLGSNAARPYRSARPIHR